MSAVAIGHQATADAATDADAAFKTKNRTTVDLWFSWQSGWRRISEWIIAMGK